MSNLGEEHNNLSRPMAEDNSATVDMSKVTVRKPKKSQPKDVTGVDDIVNDVHLENVACSVKNPHVQAVNTIRAGYMEDVTSSIKMKHDYILALFGISLNSLDDITEFIYSCDAGNYPIWEELDKNARMMVTNALFYMSIDFEAVPNAKPSTLMPTNEPPIVQDVNVTSYVGTAGVRDGQPICDTLFRPLVAEPTFEGVNVSIPRQVVEKVSTRLEHTLYGYFIGNRIAFPVVEYFARNNWGKHGLKRIMMNSKGFFFFKFDTLAGLEAVLEGGPWMIRKSPIILKKWTMDTSVHKEELTRIPVWVKLHDVPLQVFEEDGISLIATFIGKPIMLDSYTSSMCKDSWGRSSFARCLIEISSVADLVDVVTIGYPSLSGEGFTKATIRVEYDWRPPRCNVCMIFGHTHDQCPKKVVSPPVVSTTQVGNPNVVLDKDGFQMAGKSKKKGKVKSINGNRFVGPSVKQNVKYVPKAIPSEPKKSSTSMGKDSNPSTMLKSTGTTSKEGNISTSNPYAALVLDGEDDEDDEEQVENVYNESTNLFHNPH